MPSAFISYCRTDPNDAVIQALEARLAEAGWSVWRDAHIAVGDDWRPRLVRWMYACDGAILVLGPEALDRPWMVAEAAILGARKIREPGFPLSVVLLDGLDPATTLLDARFQPVALGATQAAAGLAPDELAKRAVDNLVAGAGRGGNLRDVALHAARCLERVRDDRLGELCAELLDPADDPADAAARREALAYALLAGTQDQFNRVVNDLVDRLPGKDLAQLVESVTPFTWVPAEAADGLLDPGAGRAVPRRAVCAIGEIHDFTPEQFLRRATCRPKKPFDIHPVDGLTGGAGVADLEAQVLAVVRQALLAPSFTAEQLRRNLVRRRDAGNPLVLVVPQPAPDPDVVRWLLDRWGGVCLFVLLDPSVPLAPDTFPAGLVHVLLPPLARSAEEDAFLALNEALSAAARAS